MKANSAAMKTLRKKNIRMMRTFFFVSPLPHMAHTHKRPRLVRKDKEEEEDIGMEVYYSHIDKKNWRPLHLDIKKDVRRSNCENLLKIPYDDTKTAVIFPEEDCSDALLNYEETNPADIIERLVVWCNTQLC